MVKKISKYEIDQIEAFAVDIKRKYRIKFRLEEYLNEVWVAYLEMRRKYKYSISNSFYWKNVENCIVHHFETLKKKRNAQFNPYNTKSLNKIYEGFREELVAYCPARKSNFINTIALWDYAKGLGPLKYAIVRLLYCREDDDYIMQRLQLGKIRYFELKKELQNDFILYMNS